MCDRTITKKAQMSVIEGVALRSMRPFSAGVDSTEGVGGLKVGTSVAYENAFEVSHLQKQLAVAQARICFCICLAISHESRSQQNQNKQFIENYLSRFRYPSLNVSTDHPLVTFFLTSSFSPWENAKRNQIWQNQPEGRKNRVAGYNLGGK
jgi:hypothetical protein